MIRSDAKAKDIGREAMARLDHLAGFTETPGMLTRPYLSRSHRAAADCVAGWMRAAGMTVTLDAVGTVVGRLGPADRETPLVLMGSHIDTVANAGRYDGNLGVVGAILCVEALRRSGTTLPFALEILAFGDEEGLRFPGTLRGSRAIAGTLADGDLDSRDAAGISVREALVDFGCDPATLASASRRGHRVLGYLEMHIEQGPVLESLGLPLGVVTGIAAAERHAITLTGMAGHAGTVPMGGRRDALAAAAEAMLAVEALCGARDGVVGTVGRLEASPGATNAIPGLVRFTLDLRGATPALRDEAVAAVRDALHAIGGRRGITVEIDRLHRDDGCLCAPRLTAAIAAAIARAGRQVHALPSGAGHDAMAIAPLTEVGMLFVRCRGGISHNPAESITAEDAGLAIAVMTDILARFPGTVS